MQIWPRDADVRKVLSHPVAGAFREDGPAEWPDDVYTHKQILDGSVSKDDPGAGAQAAKGKEAKTEAKAEAKKE